MLEITCIPREIAVNLVFVIIITW